MLAFLCAAPAAAQTAEAPVDAWRFSGFGTLGLAHTRAPDGWGFRRDISQVGSDRDTRAVVDSRLGLQLNYAPSAKIELVGQLVARLGSGSAMNGDNVAWALAAYRPVPDLEFRVGRVNVDVYVMSDHRNVGFAYPYVRPPVEFYGSTPGSIDGADLTKTWELEGAIWRAKGYFGRARAGDHAQGPPVSIAPVVGMMVSREADGLLVRAALTRGTVRETPRALQPLIDGLRGIEMLPVAEVAATAQALRWQLDATSAPVNYAALGLRYEQLGWEWNAEYTRVSGNPVTRFNAAYASVGHRFGPVMLYGVASLIKTPGLPVEAPAWEATLTPLLGPAVAGQAQALAAGAAYAANRSGANQRTLSVGARWNLQPQMALKVQWDSVHIGANGSRLWGNGSLEAGRAVVMSATLDFVF